MCEVGGSGEVAEVWSVEYRRARKQYECDSCWAPIKVGDAHQVYSALGDGIWSRSRACVVCTLAQQEFGEAHRFYPTPSYLIETLQDCIVDNDDRHDRWRPLLAVLLRRRRTSRIARKHLAQLWARMREHRTHQPSTKEGGK